MSKSRITTKARPEELLPPIHPGKKLAMIMEDAGLSINGLARDLHVPPGRISELVNGKRALTADTALRLARYLGTSAEMWIGLQADYELRAARHRGIDNLRDIKPRKIA